MKRLKIIKNIELRKNKSLKSITFSAKRLQDNRKSLQYIYNYYFSKNKIREKLVFQKILLMKKDLKQKQKQEKNIFKYNFYKKYPCEKNYENEISNYLKEKTGNKPNNDITEIKKYGEIKNEFLNKQHDNYIKKMGIDYENALSKLKEKFRKENDEQNVTIRKIVLNHQLGEIEKQDDIKKKHKRKTRNLSQDNIYCTQRDEHNNNNKKINNNLCSKIFKFGTGGNLYKTILI